MPEHSPTAEHSPAETAANPVPGTAAPAENSPVASEATSDTLPETPALREAEQSAVETPVGAPPSSGDSSAGASAGGGNKHWYVVKVQSGREESIKEAIERRVKIEGLEEYYGQIVIPVERVTEIRNGKRIQKERKLYPGYLMVEVEYNDRVLYLFRETSGVGDFVGGTVHRPPPPMPPREVERMLHQQGQIQEKVNQVKPEFEKGDRVKVRDGTFAGMEGEVKEILEGLSRVRVELTIFGRGVPVELEYWQVEPV
jgi:transcriptional antiterminator NusG